MELISRVIVGAFGLFMIGVSLLILVQPKIALIALRKFASTYLIHFTELGLRALAGLGFIGIAPLTDYVTPLKIWGGFLIITAFIIMLIPRRWHHAYAVWWAEKLKPWHIRICAPFSLIVGLASLWLAVN